MRSTAKLLPMLFALAGCPDSSMLTGDVGAPDAWLPNDGEHEAKTLDPGSADPDGGKPDAAAFLDTTDAGGRDAAPDCSGACQPQPVLLGSIAPFGRASFYRVATFGGIVVVGTDDGVESYARTGSGTFQAVGWIDTGKVVDVVAAGDRAIVLSQRGLTSVAVGPVGQLELLGLASASEGLSLAVEGDRAYVGGPPNQLALRVFDIGTDASPVKLASKYVGGAVLALAAVGDYLLASVEGDGLRVLRVDNPEQLPWVYDDDEGGAFSDIVVQGDLAILTGNKIGLWDGPGIRVYSVTVPQAPAELARVELAVASVRRCAFDGKKAIVAAHTDGLVWIDLTDPTTPVVGDISDIDSTALDLALLGADGIVVAGGAVDGLSWYDVINTASGSSVQLTQRVKVPGSAVDVAVAGGHAYVADLVGATLRVFDLSEPSTPTVAGELQSAVRGHSVSVAGSWAVIGGDTGDGWDGVVVVDIADPYAPRQVGALELPGTPYGITFAGKQIVVALPSGHGIHVISLEDPASPVTTGSLILPVQAATSVAANDSIVVVADDLLGMQVLAVATEGLPQLLSTLPLPSKLASIAIQDHIVVGGDFYGTLSTFDVSDPHAPVELSTLKLDTWCHDSSLGGLEVALEGDFLYVMAAGWCEALRVIDMCDPWHPRVVSRPPAWSNWFGAMVPRFGAQNGRVFAAFGAVALRVFDATCPGPTR